MAEITLTHDAVTVRVAKRDNPARMRELFAALPREVAEELRTQLSGYDPREFGEFFIGMRHYAPTGRAYFCVADATHVQVTDLDLTAGQAKAILPCIVTYLAEHPDASSWDVDLIANAMEAVPGRELGPATFHRGDGHGDGTRPLRRDLFEHLLVHPGRYVARAMQHAPNVVDAILRVDVEHEVRKSPERP